MAYTRGNLAVQERQKERQTGYVEKTTVIKRRSPLPQKEKMLYLLSVLFVVVVMGWIGMGHVKVYELNRQIQQSEIEIRKAGTSMGILEVEKQTLEMDIVRKAKELGFVQVEQNDAIHVPAYSKQTGTAGKASGN
ncbi:cell division protein FtsL [Paenibacillus lemnae]|uniref:Cell division protein FtsL n=1 Tax=Paenibacillus lemnae TaxID=1330551 RepID=A0A848M585_PAELE|nr:cell division protein FtsL [Paenibacillus lemnae]NMO94784.1 cell division protein FtsL [Paenibacillus lemnae]